MDLVYLCSEPSISGGVDQRVPKLLSAGSAKLLAADFPPVLASTAMVGHCGLRRAYWFGL